MSIPSSFFVIFVLIKILRKFGIKLLNIVAMVFLYACIFHFCISDICLFFRKFIHRHSRLLWNLPFYIGIENMKYSVSFCKSFEFRRKYHMKLFSIKLVSIMGYTPQRIPTAWQTPWRAAPTPHISYFDSLLLNLAGWRGFGFLLNPINFPCMIA